MGDDRGAALVEAAIITPVLFVLLLGCLEFGVVFRDYLTIGDAVADGARVGAIQGSKLTVGTGANGDFEIVKRLREATAGIPVESIDRIVIFEGGPSSAGSPEDQVPSACLTGNTGVAGVCTVFTDPTSTFLALQAGDVAYFECASGEPCWDPTSRDDGPQPTQIEYLGVYMEIERELITGIFGDTIDLQAASVARLEPGLVID